MRSKGHLRAGTEGPLHPQSRSAVSPSFQKTVFFSETLPGHSPSRTLRLGGPSPGPADKSQSPGLEGRCPPFHTPARPRHPPPNQCRAHG